MGHTGCGAIKAALSDYREDDVATQREVIGIVNSVRIANQTRGMSKVVDENRKLAVFSQINVDHQIGRIMAEQNVKAKIQRRELCVVGLVFDIHGVYGGKLAETYITNINVEIDIEAMCHTDVASEVESGLAGQKFKRL
jgi:carbonic anhydrase